MLKSILHTSTKLKKSKLLENVTSVKKLIVHFSGN
jgi:hypothetical protein